MIIKSLKIKSGFIEKEFFFGEDITLIHSQKNSVGKTTLIRLVLFGLGYTIPSTKGLNFNKHEIAICLQNQKKENIKLLRNGVTIIYESENEQIRYTLPTDQIELHRKIFEIDNEQILLNLLGVFYIDQEKGWTLLNRGKVIGSVHFNLENLVRGLSNKPNLELQMKLKILNQEISKYKQMSKIANYQTEIIEDGQVIDYIAPIDEFSRSMDLLYIERHNINIELQRLQKVIRKNLSFKKYISEMYLRVKSSTGEEILVNEETIIDFKDTNDYLAAKRKILEDEKAVLDNKIEILRKRQNKETIFQEVQTLVQKFDQDILKISLDKNKIESIISEFEREQEQIKKVLSNDIKIGNEIVSELHESILNYTKDLGVHKDYISEKKDYIFTSDLKSLSGAVLHKIVFSFKMSYIKVVKKYTGIVLPIILDSPSGRELDKKNIREMMNIIKRDFKEHQIIIASIFEYDFDNVVSIEINKKLLSSDSD